MSHLAMWLVSILLAGDGPWPDLSVDLPVNSGGEQDAAVVVAVEDYTYLPDVAGARDNALTWYRYFTKARKVPAARVFLLEDSDATVNKIRAATMEAAAGIEAGGTLWFVFIGHGAPSRDGNDGVLVGVDAHADELDFYPYTLTRSEILGILKTSRAGARVAVLDACFNGQTSDGGQILAGTQFTVPASRAALKEVTVLSAGREQDLAGPLPGAARPAFSYLIAGALLGWGDGDGDRRVTATEAVHFSQEVLRTLEPGRHQKPQVSGEDLPLTPKLHKTLSRPDLAKLREAIRGSAIDRVARIRETELGQPVEEWVLEAGGGIVVSFGSEPAGAMVLLDGKTICQETPCSKTVAMGGHRVEMHKEGWIPESKHMVLSMKERIVSWKLSPDFGWVTVRSTPTGLPITVDGKSAGTTPLVRMQVSAGPHQVLVTDTRYHEKGIQVLVDRGEHKQRTLTLVPRQGGLRITALEKGGGNDLAGEVWIDGVRQGETPFTEKLIVGTHRVRVVFGDRSREFTIDIREREVVERVAEFDVPFAAENAVSIKPGSRRRLVHLGISFSEGGVFAGDSAARTGVGAAISMWLKWGWFRWEPLTVGMSFEHDLPVFLGTGAAWDVVAGLYLRTLFEVAFDHGHSFWGLLGGAGYGFDLGNGWHLGPEVDVSFWPGNVLAVVLEARLGVRYGF